MSLTRIINTIIDDSSAASPYLRAIRLFELQVAIFNPNSFHKLVSTGKEDRAPSRLLQTARIFAAIKFLEEIEAKLRKNVGGTAVSIRTLAENRDYQTIFDEVIAPNGGWPRIRHSVSARTFDKNIAARRAEAEAVAKFVDFSYRYAKDPIDANRRGGITTARYVVRTAPSYASNMKKSTSKSRWRKFGSTAIFLYLLLIQKYPLMPARVSSKNFSNDLLNQTTKIVGLHAFFRAYQEVCETLISRNYTFETLDLALNCDAPPSMITPFPQDVLEQFEKAKHSDLSG